MVEATKSVLAKIEKGNLVIVESTIPPRTINDVVAPIFEQAGWKIGEDILLVHCPERVLTRTNMNELIENNRIIGGVN